MATWNQQGSGNLLGGIGLNNANAPRASDANATLAMIRENNDLQRSGANNIGLQLAQGLGGLGEAYQQQQADQRNKEFQSQWGQAYANGDRNAMRQLMAAYPEQAEKITSGMKGISEDIRESIGNIASGYRMAVASGKAENFVRENADEMRRLGIDPQYAYEQAQKDPNAAMGLADHIGMSALGMDKYYDVRDKMEGRVIDREKLSETVRSNKASEGLQARGQDIQIRGQNISAQNAALDREIRRSEIADKALDRQLQRETDQLKRIELQQKIDSNNQKLGEAKEKKRVNAINDYQRVDAVSDGYKRMADQAQAILDNESLWRATGTTGWFYNLPGSEAANIEAQIDTLKSQVGMQTLSAMKELSANGASGLGNASNKEYEGLQSSLSSLNQRQSTDEFRRSLQRIVDHSNKGQQRLKDTFKQTYPDYKPSSASGSEQQGQQSGDYSNLWGG
ncbi:phage DNA ejection protein [Providencia sp. PROV113]|uniref:phage DNA ejection protein n=1 Tax=Providencia sp. PROV113 TaxID=2949824 RepID=UPI00234AB544|nr:phage DNA ejection protein [Providencia sp. PROV113]